MEYSLCANSSRAQDVPVDRVKETTNRRTNKKQMKTKRKREK